MYYKTSKKKLITIAVSAENYERLRNLGKTADSFNDVLNHILEKLEVKTQGDNRNVST